MALTIKKVQSSSGRTPSNEDFKSGFMFYGTCPVVAGKWKSFSSSLYPNVVIKAQQLFSIDDATSAGIIPNTDNTASTGKYTITHIGATGDTIILNCEVPILGGKTAIIQIANYSVEVADTTIILQAAALAANINANSFSTGWTAISDGISAVTLKAKKDYGISLNTGTLYTATVTGAITGTLIQNVIPGTGSLYAAWYYHIQRYFAVYPQGNIWVGIIADNNSNYEEILALQASSKNSLRLLGIYNTENTNDTDDIFGELQKVQARALQIDQTFPIYIAYSCNIKGMELSDLPNGQTVTNNKLQFVISQDGEAQGNLLYTYCGFSIGNIGDKIATLSKSRVSSSDAQAIDQLNLSDGVENNIPAFANGDLLSDTAANLIAQLKDYRYIFFQVFTGNVTGTFWCGNHSFCNQQFRYAFANDNRISDKITRICNTTYIPLLESEVIFNQDGTINNSSIEIYQDAGVDAITAACITGYGAMPLISGAPIVTIDPTQDLQSTNNLNIVVKIGENGIARDITIYQGFTN